MDIGGIQPHVWFSIFVVLASAGIALLTVVLKRKDDRLREALLEIRMQREYEHRHSSGDRFERELRRRTQMQPTAQHAPAAVQHEAPAVNHATEAVAEEPAAVPQTGRQPEPQAAVEATAMRDSKARERNLAIRQAQDPAGIEFVAKSGRRRKRQAAPQEALPNFDSINAKEALSDWLNRRAASRPTAQPAIVEPAAVVEIIETPAVSQAPAPMIAEVAIPEPISKPETIVEANKTAVFIDESLWKSILGQTGGPQVAPEEAAKPATAVRFELITGLGSGLPTGMQDGNTLTRLMESNKPFTGLALAVAVAQNDGRSIAREVMPHVRQLVRSLLQDNEFACQSNDDEFVILCATDQAAEAKRRLNAINEGLWDFQLREIGSFSILFSTGDAQVTNGHVREVVSSARARLHQTRRVRKMVSLDFSASRKPASAAV